MNNKIQYIINRLWIDYVSENIENDLKDKNNNTLFKLFLENELDLYLKSKGDLMNYIIEYKKYYAEYYKNIKTNHLTKIKMKKSLLIDTLKYKIKKCVLNLQIKNLIKTGFNDYIDSLDYYSFSKKFIKIINYFLDEIDKKEDLVEKIIKERILKQLMKKKEKIIEEDELKKEILAELKKCCINHYFFIAFDVYLNIEQNKKKIYELINESEIEFELESELESELENTLEVKLENENKIEKEDQIEKELFNIKHRKSKN